MPLSLSSRPTQSRFIRLAETGRTPIRLRVDGREVSALLGDSLLVAVLVNGRRVRDSEFGDGPRAGFCLMGACQDCWLWTEDGGRLRACSTAAQEGMALLTCPPATHWPITPDLHALLDNPPEAAP